MQATPPDPQRSIKKPKLADKNTANDFFHGLIMFIIFMTTWLYFKLPDTDAAGSSTVSKIHSSVVAPETQTNSTFVLNISQQTISF